MERTEDGPLDRVPAVGRGGWPVKLLVLVEEAAGRDGESVVLVEEAAGRDGESVVLVEEAAGRDGELVVGGELSAEGAGWPVEREDELLVARDEVEVPNCLAFFLAAALVCQPHEHGLFTAGMKKDPCWQLLIELIAAKTSLFDGFWPLPVNTGRPCNGLSCWAYRLMLHAPGPLLPRLTPTPAQTKISARYTYLRNSFKPVNAPFCTLLYLSLDLMQTAQGNK